MLDVIIIGGGPAGLMCLNHLDKNLKVLLLEKNSKAGRKLLITGGGRCNLTNNKDKKSFLEEVSYNKKYLYSTIYKFGPDEVMNFFDLPLKEEKDNQIFPVSDKAGDILNYLLKNVKDKIEYNSAVKSVKKIDDYYKIVCENATYCSKKVVIATGGASFSNLGSSGDHVLFAKDLDQPIVNLYPAESSIILEEINDLAGTSFDNVVVSIPKIKKSGNLLFTHRGLSGTAIMKMSEFIYLNKIKKIIIDFIPDISNLENLLEKNRDKLLLTFLREIVTKRFANYLINKAGIDEMLKIKSVNQRDILLIIKLLKEHEYTVKKVEDIEKAYVTGGGFDLKDIDTMSFESKINSGCYLIGEAIDIHGPIGGYNLTLAFSTGYSAAISINGGIKNE